jgi:hypothetical protein
MTVPGVARVLHRLEHGHQPGPREGLVERHVEQRRDAEHALRRHVSAIAARTSRLTGVTGHGRLRQQLGERCCPSGSA